MKNNENELVVGVIILFLFIILFGLFESIKGLYYIQRFGTFEHFFSRQGFIIDFLSGGIIALVTIMIYIFFKRKNKIQGIKARSRVLYYRGIV